MLEIRPCECGEVPELHKKLNGKDWEYYLECSECGQIFQKIETAKSADEMIEAWNEYRNY